MPAVSTSASAEPIDGRLVLGGDWTSDDLPELDSLAGACISEKVLTVDLSGVEAFDGRLSAILLRLARLSNESGGELELVGASDAQQQLQRLATSVPKYTAHVGNTRSRLSFASLRSVLAGIGDDLLDSLEFLGSVTRAMLRIVTGRGGMRRRELIDSLYQAGPEALGIITLTSILVGMILAYLGAAQLQQFGASIYVADLVAVGMLREMGALMTAVVMAGRTGAAYAAQLSTMQTNEEIDAISTLGIDPLEFLVAPRILALLLMMPLLVIYADVLGIAGGAIVAGGMGVTSLQYISQLETAFSLTHVFVGLSKAIVFAVLIAIAGCRAGMSSGRNSEAVGRATTEAVVTAVVYLIVADAAINIFCQLLEI